MGGKHYKSLQLDLLKVLTPVQL